MSQRQTQYTLRDVPRAVDLALRDRARSEGKSLNEVSLEALKIGAGVTGVVHTYDDLDDFFGSWVKDPATERVLEEQREVDVGLWK